MTDESFLFDQKVWGGGDYDGVPLILLITLGPPQRGSYLLHPRHTFTGFQSKIETVNNRTVHACTALSVSLYTLV